VVPEAEFTSYYGRPVVKPSPWTFDIPTYLFLGGVAGSSALLGEGGARTGRPAVRRSGRIGALVALGSSAYFLIHDLGRPDRFYNMLRIVKPTSPMSVGTWILTAFGVPAGVAAVSEVARLLPPAVTSRVPGALLALLHRSAGPAGLAAAAIGPLVSTYTAVLLTDTASPAWFGARRELPFMFAGSALSAGAGLALVTAPLAESGPARALAIAGAAVELGAELPMRASMGIASETLDAGLAGRWHRTSRALTIGGIALLPRTVRGGGRGAARRFPGDPVLGVRGRPGQRARPALHGGPPARQIRRPFGRHPFGRHCAGGLRTAPGPQHRQAVRGAGCISHRAAVAGSPSRPRPGHAGSGGKLASAGDGQPGAVADRWIVECAREVADGTVDVPAHRAQVRARIGGDAQVGDEPTAFLAHRARRGPDTAAVGEIGARCGEQRSMVGGQTAGLPGTGQSVAADPP